MNAGNFPKVSLAQLPTPLEALDRLSADLGGPRILVKRDDQTGLATGGNKARKLEYLLEEALAQGADTLVTTGGLQSNHARQTAAAAAKLGLGCELVLEPVAGRADACYAESGNVLLDGLLGAGIHRLGPGEPAQPALDRLLDQLREQGKRPYFIPVGGSTPLGAMGYVQAASEAIGQLDAMGIAVDHMVVATGSAGTHAGILAGLAQLPRPRLPRVQGIAVSATSAQKEVQVRRLLATLAPWLGIDAQSLVERIHVDDRFVGPGYGAPTPAMIRAVQRVAQTEGLLLDPVYTGKAMSGLIQLIREGVYRAGETVLFWHTGGIPALFAYPGIWV